MEKGKEDAFWKWVHKKFNVFRDELKKDSVASHPRTPVDCCNPPKPSGKTGRSESGRERGPSH